MDECTTGASTAAERESIVHLLNRAAFGPTPELVDHVRCVGRARWIEQQLHPATIDDPELDARLSVYPSLAMSTAQLVFNYPPRKFAMNDPATAPDRILAELNASLMTRTVHGRAQLEAVLTDFWFNHFNVFAAKGPTRWTIMAYVRDVIRPHVLGRFEDLLRASAESPAMLYYLDNYLSAAEGTRGPRSGINENYARELLELHTLGVDGGYAQEDVGEVARVFTGWSMDITEPTVFEFVYRPAWHDTDYKLVLGVPIGGGQMDEGHAVLRQLARHASTATFIATRLAQRLVGDDPPSGLVLAARDTYLRTDGDLREVVRVILTSDAFDDPRHRNVKVKSPLRFVASALRALGAEVRRGFGAAQLVGELGQPLLESVAPTGWSDAVEDVVSAGGMLARFEAARRITSRTVKGLRIDMRQWDYLDRGARGVNRLLMSILQRPASVQTRHAVERALRDGAHPAMAAALTLSSPEFQQC